MPIWTVQPLAVWQQVNATGEAWVDPRRVNREGWVPPSFSWLAWQMRYRIDGSLGRLPWFAYCERPDLRQVRHTLPVEEIHVLIEFDPPPTQCLSFRCWAWHEVFGGQFLALTAAEERDWNARVRREVGTAFEDCGGLLPDPLQEELEASWRRLFRADLPARSWRRGRGDCHFGRKRETVVEVIRSAWVRRAREIVGTGTWIASARRRVQADAGRVGD